MSASDDGRVRLFHLETLESKFDMNFHMGPIVHLNTSLHFITSIDNKGFLLLTNHNKFEVVSKFYVNKNAVHACELSNDAK